MSLHGLAPELISLILYEITSPRDLYSLISASSACFRVFQLSPESHLEAVLVSTIAPEALYHAVAVAHTPRGPFRQDDRTVKRMLGTIAQQYFNGSMDRRFPRDKATLVSICRLHQQISRLILDYAGRALGRINKLLSHADSHADPRQDHDSDRTAWRPISASERGRFERAFLRHELYCRLYPADKSDPFESLFSAQEQFENFIRHLRPWEAEEINCVHRYICWVVEDYFIELDQQVYEAVLAAPGVQLPRNFTSNPSPDTASVAVKRPSSAISIGLDEDAHDRNCSSSSEPELCRFHQLECVSLGLFAREEAYEFYSMWTSYVAAEGLGLIAQLAVADRSYRRTLIRSKGEIWRPFLPEALEIAEKAFYTSPMSPHPTSVDGGAGSSGSTGNNSSGRISHGGDVDGTRESDAVKRGRDGDDPSPLLGAPGYRLFTYHGGREFDGGRRDGEGGSPLRDTAYVFWDADRVRISWVTAAMKRAMNLPWRDIGEMYNRERGASARERLRGVMMPLSEFQNIIDEFSSTH